MRLILTTLAALLVLTGCLPAAVEQATPEQARLLVAQHAEVEGVYEVVLAGQQMSEVTLVVSAAGVASIELGDLAEYPDLLACQTNPDLDRSYWCRFTDTELVDLAFVTELRPLADAIVFFPGDHTAYLVVQE